MNFSVFMPSQSKYSKVPALLYLAGLTCTEETFMIKAGALKLASDRGLALICPDTSPRGANIEGEDTAWDFGTGAGSDLDSTQSPWAKNYRMSYKVTRHTFSFHIRRFKGQQS